MPLLYLLSVLPESLPTPLLPSPLAPTRRSLPSPSFRARPSRVSPLHRPALAAALLRRRRSASASSQQPTPTAHASANSQRQPAGQRRSSPFPAEGGSTPTGPRKESMSGPCSRQEARRERGAAEGLPARRHDRCEGAPARPTCDASALRGGWRGGGAAGLDCLCSCVWAGGGVVVIGFGWGSWGADDRARRGVQDGCRRELRALRHLVRARPQHAGQGPQGD
jgi:hypothetical protein